MAKRIMVVEDEKDLSKVLHVALAAHGYEVIIANDGKEALVKAVKEKPSLILLDVVMPHMDGLEVLHRLKLDPKTKHIPVIMLSGRDDIDSVDEAKEIGAKDYITKPYNTEMLLDAVKRNLPA